MFTALPPEKEYYSIGEASRITGVKPYILRYWEKEVPSLRPMRRTSGHRKFTRRDMETIRRLHELLREKGMTLEGAKKQLRQEAKRGPVQAFLPEFDESSAATKALKEVKEELREMLESLRASEALDA